MLPQKITFVDTETTGLSATRDRVIEIGIVRIEDGKETARYKSLIRPDAYLSPFISSMTGITQEELENAPSFREIHKDILEILEDSVFVAHNVRFDYSFLKNEFRRVEKSFSPKQFCTARLSRMLFPDKKGHSVDAIMQRFGISCENRHRAFDDAYVLWEFYQKLQKIFSEEQLEKAIHQAMKRPSVPLAIDQKQLEALPQSPGVYIFYGENNTPLYVGKSINIKERVLSHFSSDHLSSKEMAIAQQLKSIETKSTTGELGALLQEAALVKKLQPLYNRQLRNSRKVVLMKKRTNKDGFLEMYLEEAIGIDPFDTENIIGVFKSKKQAKDTCLQMVKEHKLCEKLTGLEKTKGACFGYRLGNCNGACVQEEKPIAYNLRFLEAFSTNFIKPWPFSSPVALIEQDSMNDSKEYFVIDRWCLLGSVETHEDAINENMTREYVFDVDTYKILYKFISSKQKKFSVVPFSQIKQSGFSEV